MLFLEKSFMTKGQKYWKRTLRLRDVLLSIIQFLPPHHKRGLAVYCQYFEYILGPEFFCIQLIYLRSWSWNKISIQSILMIDIGN